MKKVSSAKAHDLPDDEKQQAYNALDTCVPMGIAERLLGMLSTDPDANRVYRFEMAMQGPAFTMACRGMAVNEAACAPVVAALEAKEARCEVILNALAKVWGVPSVNPRSPVQVKALLYGACGEKAYHNHDGGETTNENALQDISIRSPIIGTIAQTILAARGYRKAIGFVKATRSPDGRLRCTFNVGSTKFGRWSSNKDIFKEGLNFFNLPKDAREIIVPSTPTRVLVNIDLKQAESYIVAQIANDLAYIAAHETGNAHVAVAYDVFGCPTELVKVPGPDGITPYAKAKKIQHGTNYGLGERHAARMAGMRVGLIREARRKYFTRYVGVHRRIETMGKRLRADPEFLYFTGRPHRYLGYWRDEKAIREALSGEPQGGVADILCVALYRIWAKYDTKIVWLLNQNYDSILFECEEEGFEETLALIKEEMKVPVQINGRTVTIACDIGIGKTWKEASG